MYLNSHSSEDCLLEFSEVETGNTVPNRTLAQIISAKVRPKTGHEGPEGE
jgi:hypothetical protein